MAQIKNPLDEVRIPFAKMTFTPDVPSTALQPNEYNYGENVETDVRGIRSMAGDEEILDTVPGIPTFVTGGFRQNNEFWFIVATYEIDPLDPTNPDANLGRWYASNGTTTWYDITPGGVPILGYRQNTNITESWNGTVPLFNDTRTAPMFWPEPTALDPSPIMTQYSNLILPANIYNITYVNPTTQKIVVGFTSTGSDISGTTLTIGTLTNGEVFAGMSITGTGVSAATKIVSGSGSIWTVNISQTVAATAIGSQPYASAPYTVGQQIVISDVNNFFNGVFTVVSSTTTTIDYLAVPGAAYPGGPLGVVNPAYTWNYNPNWSKVIANFMRMYSTPNVGSILVAGNLTVTLIDGVTVEQYPTTVQWSQAFGLNQAPRTWVPTITNVANQLEVPIRGETLDAFPCNGQFFLCSYWDTVVFSPINYSTTSAPILGVRQFNQGRGLLSSNCWANTDKLVYGIDARDVWVFDGQDFQGLGNQRVKNWLFDKLDPEYYDRVFMEVNTQRSQVEIYYPDDDSVDGVPNKMLSYRYDLDCWNSPRDVSDATFSCESPIFEFNTPNYDPLLSSRTVVYARGVEDGKLVQKDQGYEFINGAPIASEFRRDNIKLLKDYSGKLMVHRILPEVVNLGAIQGTDNELPIDPATSTNKGNITVTVEGANSVGSAPTAKTPVTIAVDADGIAGANPWAQINQNAFRVNSLKLSNSSNNSVWMCSATTWQVTQVEDDR
jgi:hypothetical protein